MKNAILVVLLVLAQDIASQPAIAVSKTGKGQPILFLPGFTTPGSVWDETIQNLERSYESHVVSYAGFNGLAPIDTPWYEPIRQELIDYVRKNNLSRLTLVGHSMGGNLAIEIAAALPDHVSGMILVESIPCMREVMMPGVPASSLKYDSKYNQQILGMHDDAFIQMATGIAHSMTTVAAKADSLVKWSVRADRKTYAYGYTDLLKLDLRDKLSEIKIRTLILEAGAAYPDKDMVHANYQRQYSNLKSAEFLMNESSKHFIMFDQPEWFYTTVNNFLKKNDD